MDMDENGVFEIPEVDILEKQGAYIDHFKKADLISLNLGSNDVFSVTFQQALTEVGELSDDPAITAIIESAQKSGQFAAGLIKVLESYQSLTKTVQTIEIFSDHLSKTFEQFKVNFTKALSEIYALNPDATIVIVGVYNPLANFTSSRENGVPLSGLTQSMTTKLNDYLSDLAAQHSDCYFADVVGTSTYKASMDDTYFWDYFSLLVHPDLEGHRFMAQQILAALPEALPAPVVTASNVASSGKIKLTWSAVPGAAKYAIYRSTKKNGTYSKMYTVTGTSYTNTSAKAGKGYYYKVKALSADPATPDSRFSEPVYRTCDLAKPTGLQVTKKNGHPCISWKAVEGADKYAVYRCKSKTGTFVKIGTTAKTTFTNTSAIPGNTYYYKVKALKEGNSAATSVFSGYVYCKAK